MNKVKMSYTIREYEFEKLFLKFVFEFVISNSRDKKNIAINMILDEIDQSNHMIFKTHHLNIFMFLAKKIAILNIREKTYLMKILESLNDYVLEKEDGNLDLLDLAFDLIENKKDGL